MAKKGKATVVQRVVANIAALILASAAGMSGEKVAERVDELLSITAYLARLPSANANDLNLKLAVLCRRLREHLDPDDSEPVLTALLAESIRDDFERQRQLVGRKPKALR